MDIIPGEEWVEYYSKFPYFSHETIRDGCHPWKMVKKDSNRAIVLVHGLTDSPYFLLELAKYFYEELQYSVFIPLLQCHGLKQPGAMEGVSREEWKKNVAFAMTSAGQFGIVSIGGLSTGGALSLYAILERAVDPGCLYLFSAALELSGGLAGRIKEIFLRSFLLDIYSIFSRKRPLLEEHPYRYAFTEMKAAGELAHLMKEISRKVKGHNLDKPSPVWVFAAHSEGDNVVSLAAVFRLKQKFMAERFFFWRIAKQFGVSHAGLVLKENIYSPEDGTVLLEKGNPLFSKLLEKIREMEGRINGIGS